VFRQEFTTEIAQITAAVKVKWEQECAGFQNRYMLAQTIL